MNVLLLINCFLNTRLAVTGLGTRCSNGRANACLDNGKNIMVEGRTTYNGLDQTKDNAIQNVLQMHLKNRSIDCSFTTKEEGREGNGLDMTRLKLCDKTIGSRSNESNLVTYNSIVNDTVSHEEHYLSLKSFFAACNGAYRSELLQLLFPIYSVFVLEQVEMEQKASAQAFFQKYIGDHDERYKRDTEELLQLLKSSDEQSKAKLVNMKKKKFHVVLTSKTVNYLMQHLRNNNHSVLLQTINKNLDIRILDDSNYDAGQDWLINTPVEIDPNEDEHVRVLKDSIKKLDTLSKTKPSVTLHSFVNAYQGLSAVTFSPNSNVICAGFEDASIRLWSLNMKKLGQSNQKTASAKPSVPSADATSSDSIVLRGHKGPVYAVRFLPEGNAMLSASEDCSVRLWSVQSQAAMVDYIGHNNPVWDISSGCKGSYFVSASQDHTLRLWASEYSFPLRIFAGHLNSVDCVQFHPNGNYIASGSSDKTCRLWDLQSAQFVRVFVGHESPIYTLSFSPDGTYLVSAGDDNRVLVWDIRNGRILKDLRGHTDTLYSVAFSKDGSMLVSGGLDNSIRVWNAETVLKTGNEGKSASDCLISAYSTKATSVLELHFSQGNLLLAAGLHETR